MNSKNYFLTGEGALFQKINDSNVTSMCQCRKVTCELVHLKLPRALNYGSLICTSCHSTLVHSKKNLKLSRLMSQGQITENTFSTVNVDISKCAHYQDCQ